MEVWWLTSRGARQWSIEERRARWAIYAVAVPIFLVIYLIAALILEILRVGQTATVLIGIAIGGYSALFVSRWACGLIWPELMREADRNAATRLGARRV